MKEYQKCIVFECSNKSEDIGGKQEDLMDSLLNAYVAQKEK